MERTKQAWKRGSRRELGFLRHPRQVQLLVWMKVFQLEELDSEPVSCLSFLSGKVLMVSTDFGKYT